MGQAGSSEARWRRGRSGHRHPTARRSQSVPTAPLVLPPPPPGSYWLRYKALRNRILGKTPNQSSLGPRDQGGRTFGATRTFGRGWGGPGGSVGALKGKAARDQARVFRDLVAGWSAQDLHCLVVEYEAAAALRELTWRADAARPPVPSLASDLGRLLASGQAADVRLVFRGEETPAHASILRARSTFFRRLLEGKASGELVEVTLPSHFTPIDKSAFRLLLQYLYTGDISSEARAGLGGDIELMLRLKEEFGCPNTLEVDAYKMLEEAEAGDAVLIFVSNAASTPLPHDLSLEEAGPSYLDDEEGGTLRAGGAAVAAPESEAEDGTVSAEEEMAIWRRGLAEMQPSGSRSRPLSLASSSTTPQRHAELRCHSAVLAARSPFLRSLISRKLAAGAAGTPDEPLQLHLDEAILPRIYAPVLLHAFYTDAVDLNKVIRNCPIPINSLSEVQAIASGKCQVQPIDEATEIYHIAQFLEFPALAHGCETRIVEHVTAECVVGVYNWASEAHGSPFVRRHCVDFLCREFARIAGGPLLFDLEEPLLYETLASDFVQASELEILNAVVKWGEQTLMRRLEEREPNLIATTTHSISRKGLRRSDLSDEELKDILANLMPLVRTDYILPPFHQALVSATSRGLVSCPPSDLPGTTATSRSSGSDSSQLHSGPASRRLRRRRSPHRSLSTSSDAVIEGGGLGNPDGHWLHPHCASASASSSVPRMRNPLPHRRTPRPRFFLPYFREAVHQLHKRLQESPDTRLLSHEPPPLNVLTAGEQSRTLPDALYMLKPSTSRHRHVSSDYMASSSDDEGEGSPLWTATLQRPDESPLPAPATIAEAEARVAAYLRTSTTVAKGLACGCAHHRKAVLKQVRLRALRELGCPDSALRVLRRPETFPHRRSSSPSQGSVYEEDPLGPLELCVSSGSLDEREAQAWPDLMSSASLGRDESGVGAQLRETCERVSRWSTAASAPSPPHGRGS